MGCRRSWRGIGGLFLLSRIWLLCVYWWVGLLFYVEKSRFSFVLFYVWVLWWDGQRADWWYGDRSEVSTEWSIFIWAGKDTLLLTSGRKYTVPYNSMAFKWANMESYRLYTLDSLVIFPAIALFIWWHPSKYLPHMGFRIPKHVRWGTIEVFHRQDTQHGRRSLQDAAGASWVE